MLRNAVLHITNEQPLLADLFELPNPTDVALRLTNLRTLDGKKPIFVDDSNAVFLFPNHRVSFVEIPAAAMAGNQAPSGDVAGTLPVPVAAGVLAGSPGDPAAEDDELEIDEDFLRRIREV
jgi:hypothetical protein